MSKSKGSNDSFFRDESDSMRKHVILEELCLAPKPRILLVDDDPFFSHLLKRTADKLNLHLVSYENHQKLIDVRDFGFDIIIMDHDLGGGINGYRVVEIIERYTFNLPTILISGKKRYDIVNWPESIKEFVHKNLGPIAILDAAIEAYQIEIWFDKFSEK